MTCTRRREKCDRCKPTTATPAAVEAFQRFYLAELDNRVQRSEVVGAITLKKGSAALFFDPAEGKFTLAEKMPDVEEANVFDCVPREQWGRMVMLFGHATDSGGYIPSGHATMDGNTLKIKLASGHYYRLDVDASLAHLQPFVCTDPPKAKEPEPRRVKRTPLRTNRNGARRNDEAPREAAVVREQVSGYSDGDDESDDLTEEDLRRLRGEIPLSSSPKKKWKR